MRINSSSGRKRFVRNERWHPYCIVQHLNLQFTDSDVTRLAIDLRMRSQQLIRNLQHKYSAGHCPLSDVHESLKYLTFREIAIPHLQVISCHYTDIYYYYFSYSWRRLESKVRPFEYEASPLNTRPHRVYQIYQGYRTMTDIIVIRHER
jgi:hypothetical protein